MILAGVVGCKTPDRPNLVEYVNPNIGTVHSRWFFYTPAAEPFGMAKLGASTNGTYGNNQGWEAIGYEDNHTSIDGFPRRNFTDACNGRSKNKSRKTGRPR